MASSNEIWLIFGKSGWIGSQLSELLQAKGSVVHLAQSRLEDRESVGRELDTIKPTLVLNAAGLTGRPNVDWCEDHKVEVIRANVVGLLTLADLCLSRGIHLTNYATGCIYEYDPDHPLGSGKGFTEEDVPNFHGSYYAHTKALVEDLIRAFPNVLTLRVRMPLSDDLHPRNFITKIITYDRVVNVPNSMTVLHDMLPVSLIMAQRKLTGVYNFTNPGVISHNELLEMYKEFIDPSLKYENFDLEQQAKILKAGRSNNELDTTKLQSALPDVKLLSIKDACLALFTRMRAKLARR